MKKISTLGHDLDPQPAERRREWEEGLDPQRRRVLCEGGTEPPGTGELLHEKRRGLYVSALGGLPLFSSEAKFESGTGWPSFTDPIAPDHVVLREDRSHGMRRVEVLDARSGAHLGHVFDDGPGGRKRYCINSAALRFVPEGEPLPPESRPAASPRAIEKAYFAAGCFWGVEEAFRCVPGVVATAVGYAGGHAPSPSYERVCSCTTGHAETVEVQFDPERVSYEELLDRFFGAHDPTTRDRQGPDVGTQYRSAVFYLDERQKQAAEAARARRQERSRRPIVTQLAPAGPFWRAEEYHQQYLLKRGMGACHVPIER